jgi:hypothetical protein
MMIGQELRARYEISQDLSHEMLTLLIRSHEMLTLLIRLNERQQEESKAAARG